MREFCSPRPVNYACNRPNRTPSVYVRGLQHNKLIINKESLEMSLSEKFQIYIISN